MRDPSYANRRSGGVKSATCFDRLLLSLNPESSLRRRQQLGVGAQIVVILPPPKGNPTKVLHDFPDWRFCLSACNFNLKSQKLSKG